ncbi:MAG: hypothetical protein JO352_36140 [Chloroflexi bacterium]|nr:hypothetical protein [Chloroflexota bacterium]MBV9600526.1 hypothetical protein [Chloroflexota bacterium]
MKARSASLTLYHFEAGHHREVCLWHDQDHKPEVIGTVPYIFISQRWVATPELLAEQPASRLEHHGGEYVNLYWSSGTPAELESNFSVLGQRLTLLGRMQPMQFIHRTWGQRLVPVAAHARRGLQLSAEAATFAPQTSALMLVVMKLLDSDARDGYARWHESVHLPMILDTGLFTAAVKLASPSDPDLMVLLYYTDHPDPCAAYREFHTVSRSWRHTDKHFAEIDRAREMIHSGMYIPSIGHYDYYP